MFKMEPNQIVLALQATAGHCKAGEHCKYDYYFAKIKHRVKLKTKLSRWKEQFTDLLFYFSTFLHSWSIWQSGRPTERSLMSRIFQWQRVTRSHLASSILSVPALDVLRVKMNFNFWMKDLEASAFPKWKMKDADFIQKRKWQKCWLLVLREEADLDRDFQLVVRRCAGLIPQFERYWQLGGLGNDTGLITSQ